LHPGCSQRVLARRPIAIFISIDREIGNGDVARCAAQVQHVRREIDAALSTDSGGELPVALDPNVIGNRDRRGYDARAGWKDQPLGRLPSRIDGSLKLNSVVGGTIALHPLGDDRAVRNFYPLPVQ